MTKQEIDQIRRGAKSAEKELVRILAVIERTDQFMDGRSGWRTVNRNMVNMEGRVQALLNFVESDQALTQPDSSARNTRRL